MAIKRYEVSVAFNANTPTEYDVRQQQVIDLIGFEPDVGSSYGTEYEMKFSFDTLEEQVASLERLKEFVYGTDEYGLWVNAHIAEMEGEEVVSSFHLTDFANTSIDRMFKLVDLLHEVAIEMTHGDPHEAALILAYASGNVASLAGIDDEKVKDFLQMGIDEYKEPVHTHNEGEETSELN